MIQRLRGSNEKGFTLIELMIVIAIIGILAAIAVPQFLTYRMRSYNTAAKSVVHNLKADEGNLNSELGVYGHTEANPLDLTQATAAVGAADSNADPRFELPATAARAGARIAGSWTNTIGETRQMALAITLGSNMIAYASDINDAVGNSTVNIFARHFKGDTCYGLDMDVENTLYTVSNPNWPSQAGIQATTVDPAAATPPQDDLSGQPGGGLPTANWTRTN